MGRSEDNDPADRNPKDVWTLNSHSQQRDEACDGEHQDLHIEGHPQGDGEESQRELDDVKQLTWRGRIQENREGERRNWMP